MRTNPENPQDLLLCFREMRDRPRLLVIAARPGDEIRGCGGTVYEWTQSGTRVVTIVALAEVQAGPAAAERHFSRVRDTASCDAAAATLGCDLPRYWHAPTLSLTYSEEPITRLVN